MRKGEKSVRFSLYAYFHTTLVFLCSLFPPYLLIILLPLTIIFFSPFLSLHIFPSPFHLIATLPFPSSSSALPPLPSPLSSTLYLSLIHPPPPPLPPPLISPLSPLSTLSTIQKQLMRGSLSYSYICFPLLLC